MITPEQFKNACGNLLSLVNKQTAVSTKAKLGDEKALNDLNATNRQLNDDMLRVLVMGRFSSGKSTFLNALMGQNFLPAKPLPTTAVIGEIVYGEHPAATLFPKQGYAGGDRPFDIRVEELNKYITIDNNATADGDELPTTPYHKVIIKYPLHICSNGIMFVDSPGLDDPTCHDAITQEYLPSADAILYCMNSSQAYSAYDKMEIERLVAMGYKSIIFVLTYFDVVEDNDRKLRSHEADEVKSHYTKILSQYTDLGSDGIFFVGSLPALMGKLNNDQEQIESSHILPLEKQLESILFNEKGRMKLVKALYATRKVNRTTGQHLTDLIEVANSDKSGLSNRINEAQRNLDQASAKAVEISTQFKMSSQSIVGGAKDRASVFFSQTILANLEKWVDGYKPSEGERLSAFHPKTSCRAFMQGCIRYVQTKIETEMAQWSETELIKDYVQPQLEALAAGQNENLDCFEADLKRVRESLQLSVDESTLNKTGEVTTGNRIFSAIAGVVAGGPGGGIIGGMLGWKALVPALIAQVGAGLALGIIASFTPIGVPVVVITAIVSAIVAGGFTGLKTIEKSARGKIKEILRHELTARTPDVAASIGDSVASMVEKMQAAVDEELASPVAQSRRVLEEAQKSVTEEASAIKKRVDSYVALRKENNTLAADLDNFAEGLSA